MSTTNPDELLRALFEEHSTRVLAYAARHVGPTAAQDVVSEVFLVAWRRLEDVPTDALPWLLVVARNTISNRRRATARSVRLTDQLTALERTAGVSEGADVVAVRRQSMLTALRELSPPEREAVLLTGWDGLSIDQACLVAGCSRRAFELRLHRSRSRLRRLMAADEQDQPSRHRSTIPFGLTKETMS